MGSSRRSSPWVYRAVFWIVTPFSGVCAFWLVNSVGVIVGGLLESAVGSLTVFWEGSFLIPAIYGAPTAAVVAGFGGIYQKRWAVLVGFGANLVYFFFVASAYYSSAVAPYASAKGVFWWIFLVGIIGGGAACALGGVLGHYLSNVINWP